MSTEPTLSTQILRRSEDCPKVRKCLRCKTPFESEWSGERICKKCKAASTWRNGLA